MNLSIDEARKTPGVVISLADSQILTWINELNGTQDYDESAKKIKATIKSTKKEKNTPENKTKIKDLYQQLYQTDL